MDTNTDPVRAREILAHVIATEEAKGYAGRFGDEQRHVPEWVALEAISEALASAPPSGGERRDREADRARFTDPAFNNWLDTGISDAGHTVWDMVGDVADAWAGWEARQFAGDAVLLAECCGREECGGECGNDWRGMGMYRKPASDSGSHAPPSAPLGVDEMQRRLDREESDHARTIDQRDAAEDALGRMFQAVTGRPAEWSSAWGYADAIEEVEEHVAALAQQQG